MLAVIFFSPPLYLAQIPAVSGSLARAGAAVCASVCLRVYLCLELWSVKVSSARQSRGDVAFMAPRLPVQIPSTQ